MYSSAYVYIYTYGFVYIFCIDIQIGLILSKYQKCFVQSVLPVMSWPYTCVLLQCCFFSFEIWSLFSFWSCSVAGFVHVLLLFKVFLCCFLPMAWYLHHSVLMLQHVNFAFNFYVQHAMKVVLFRLINICWSFHCFCFVANLWFSPLPDVILYFWMNLTSAVFLYFRLFNFACAMDSFLIWSTVKQAAL